MSSKNAIAQHKVYAKGCELRITARLAPNDDPNMYSELIVRTTKLWIYLATQIEQGVKQLPPQIAQKTVEQSVADLVGLDDTMKGWQYEPAVENRVTVFDWNHRFELTLHSDTEPQSALDLWWAMDAAKQELEKLYPSQSPEKGSNSSDATPQGTNTPPTPVPAVEGVINATKAPSPNNPQYTDGQLVSYTVDKIVAGSNQGSATFAMWGPLGKQYALVTVYKTDSKGQPKRDYETIVPVLNSIGLSFDKPEARGNWRMVCKAAHFEKDGKTKEYMNVVSLVPF